MRNVSAQSCTQNQNTHFVLNNFFFTKVVSRNNVDNYCTAGQATDDSKIRRMRFALDNKGFKHSEYVIHVTLPR